MTLLQYTVPSTQGSFYLHTEHIHRSIVRGNMITNCIVFAIINFFFFFFSLPDLQLFASFFHYVVFCLPETILTAS